MPRTDHFAERIGAVFLPEADTVDVDEDITPKPEGPVGFPVAPIALPTELIVQLPQPPLWTKQCSITLEQGCYTLSFVPTGTPILGNRYRGTLRVERTGTGIRFSADLYRYQLFEHVFYQPAVGPIGALNPNVLLQNDLPSDEAADTGGKIPVYHRSRYYSYLKGTQAQLTSIVPKVFPCTFSLEFDEFVYTHPATGFSGSFSTAPTRTLRFVFQQAAPAGLHSGVAYVGSTKVGLVSIRWVSSFYRRAHLQLHTLQGAVSPPASVENSTFASIFADVGWDLTVADGGTVQLPAALSGVDINSCWSEANLHTLMTSVPGYNAADLDSVWRVHLVAVPAELGCSRGIMFDSSFGADPNAVRREGSATFSHDGYPAVEVPDGASGSHYDGAANGQQRNHPRAFLRSATHEVGHAFNQIHQNFEAGLDNSIMSPTPSVATVIGLPGTFPDDINLAFNDTVKKHLRHLPDPAVRPGAMEFFGSAIAAPEAADIDWLETAELDITLSADRISLGEPVTVDFSLTNMGELPLPVPESLDVEALTVRVNVTDPTGRITFMRPDRVKSCPRATLGALPPQETVTGSTTLFWGKDGFAFETPGRHIVQVIVLWKIVGIPVAAAAERDVFVNYPVTANDNEVAALMLDPQVGAAVAAGNTALYERAAERVSAASAVAAHHPAIAALERLGMIETPKPSARKRSSPQKRSR